MTLVSFHPWFSDAFKGRPVAYNGLSEIMGRTLVSNKIRSFAMLVLLLSPLDQGGQLILTFISIHIITTALT